jgi:hypothetical protein
MNKKSCYVRVILFIEHRDRGFEFRSRFGCPLFSVMCSKSRDGRSPVQVVLPKCLKGFIVSEINSESEQARVLNA